MEIKLTTLACKRCKGEWIPRSINIPDVCPKCKSKYWQTDVKFKTISKAQKQRKRK